MQKNDIIQRFIFEEGNVRGELVRLTDSYQTITAQHAYPTTIKHLLGELLATSCLLSAIIKLKGRLSVQFQGKDPLKLLIGQCNHEFQVRGLAQWTDDISSEELSVLLKNGKLAIIISSDTSVTPYQGVVAWQGHSLAQSIEGYFKDSEQLPTRLWLAVNETTAAGLFLQTLPEEDSKKTNNLENGWEHLVHLTSTLTNEELLTLDNQTLLHRLYSQEEIRLFEPESVTFKCTCTIERSENAILMLGKEEAEQELQDKQKIVVTCEFCNTEYAFDRAEVATIFKNA